VAITPLTFTGVSTFSSDLQSILTRSQQIAALPLQALQQDQQEYSDRKTALQSLQSFVQQTSKTLTSLSELSGGGSMTVTSSSSKVSAAETGDVVQGRHIITAVTQLAEATVAVTATGYATADQTAVTEGANYLELWVGDKKLAWTMAAGEDNLNSIRDWINAADLGVSASLVSTNSGYVLSVNADSPGANAIGLYTGADKSGANLLTTIVDGTNLQFSIDGQPVERSSNTVTDVVPGISLTFNQKTDTGESITIGTQRNTDSINYILQTLNSQYNLLQGELAKHTGKSGGALTGDTAIIQLRAAMTSLGSLATMSGTGLSFDENGTMQFDPSVLKALSATGLQGLVSQLSDSGGVLAQIQNEWDGLADSTNGFFASELGQIDRSNDRLTAQMEALSERINVQQATLQARLQAADTLLATLQSQQNMLNATLDSLSYVAFGKTSTKNSSG
jgi:flagellar hook-associated protein 2